MEAQFKGDVVDVLEVLEAIVRHKIGFHWYVPTVPFDGVTLC